MFPGDDLTTTATVEAVHEDGDRWIVDMTVSTTNQDGAQVFSGQASAHIDP